MSNCKMVIYLHWHDVVRHVNCCLIHFTLFSSVMLFSIRCGPLWPAATLF